MHTTFQHHTTHQWPPHTPSPIPQHTELSPVHQFPDSVAFGNVSLYSTWERLIGACPSPPNFIQYNTLHTHLCSHKWHDFIFSYSCMVFHCVPIEILLYSKVSIKSSVTGHLQFPGLGPYEHMSTSVFSHFYFFFNLNWDAQLFIWTFDVHYYRIL